MSYSYERANGSNSKQPGGFYNVPVDPYVEKDLHEFRENDQRLKFRIRFFKVIMRFLTFAVSVFAVYTQVDVLRKFNNTKGIMRQGPEGTERNPWAKGTELWPTYLLLSTSALTGVVSLITILSYFRGVKQANAKANTIGTPVTVIEVVAHLVVWIGTSIGYRTGKTGQDLWGWSCSPGAKKIQDIFPEVDFSFFCRMQGGSWVASIVQVVLTIVTLTVWGLAWRRSRQKKKMQIQEGLLLSTNYTPPPRA